MLPLIRVNCDVLRVLCSNIVCLLQPSPVQALGYKKCLGLSADQTMYKAIIPGFSIYHTVHMPRVMLRLLWPDICLSVHCKLVFD